jgi:hypothetical protein
MGGGYISGSAGIGQRKKNTKMVKKGGREKMGQNR